jgi:hypothetical protein
MLFSNHDAMSLKMVNLHLITPYPSSAANHVSDHRCSSKLGEQGWGNVLSSQGYRTAEGAVVDEYGTMAES